MIILRKILNVFFPDGIECAICDQLLYKRHLYLCESCLGKLDFIVGKSCKCCGKSLPKKFDGDFCLECISKEQYHLATLACVHYDDFSANVIYKLKYQHKRYIGRMLGSLMSDLLKATYIDDVNLIVPVPIWRGKMRYKGYNHSAIIAKTIGENCNKKVIEDFLVRKRKSRPLKDLSKVERNNELINIFELNDSYKNLLPQNRRIILIDDIYTTGATVRECCKVLRSYGYNDIIVMVFATGFI